MKTNRKIEVSKHLVLESSEGTQDEDVIFNNTTGNRAAVNQQTVALLAILRSPLTITELLEKVQANTSEEREIFETHIETLLQQTLLVWSDQVDAQLATSQELASEDLVASQTTTFARCPSAKLDEIQSGAYVFCGVGIDFATTAKSGAKLGPAALRLVSAQFLTYDRDIFTRANRGWYNADLGRTILKGCHFQDVGNVSHILGENPATFYARVQKTAETVCAAGGIPIFLGGDHSITAPLVEGCILNQGDDVLVIHLDAHTDLGEWVVGSTHHHGNVMRKLLSHCPNVSLVQLGVRGFSGEPDSNDRCTTITQAELEYSLEDVLLSLPKGKKCYISIDVDALDPSYAPGTGTPVPMGMHPRQMLSILKQVAEHNYVIGIDLVELCPDQDRGDITSSFMFHMLMSLLGYIDAK
jgi:agmatinase